MGKTEIRIAAALVLLSIGVSSHAQDFHWDRVPMDGSRACVEANVRKGSARKVKAVVDKVQPQMAELKRVIGYSDRVLTKYHPESPLSNWYADLMLDQSEVITGRRCDVSIGNFGGIRVDMPKGDVIVDDIRSMFPFKNDIVILEMSGKRLMDLFTHMARTHWEVLGGVRIVANRKKVESVTVGGEPLDESRIYRIITNTFLLHGGDGLYLADMSEKVDIRPDGMYETVMAWINARTAEGKHISGEVDGRIVLLNPPASDLHTEKNGFDVDEAALSGAKTAAHRLNILHTNDTHSHIDPIRAGSHAGMAGVVERAVFVDSVRRADGRRNVLLLDAGDFEQGTPYFSLFRGKVEIASMNKMRYDAATLGNHEFDNGIDDLARRMKKARFKLVLSNYEFDHPGLKKVIRPYAIFRRGGMKIGVVGVLTDVSSVVDADIVSQLRYKNPARAVNAVAEFLKKEKGCDKVIVLSHLGISDKSANMGDIQMATQLRNVDCIIGGHSHTNLTAPVVVSDADGKALPVVTDYYWGIYVGEIKIN